MWDRDLNLKLSEQEILLDMNKYFFFFFKERPTLGEQYYHLVSRKTNLLAGPFLLLFLVSPNQVLSIWVVSFKIGKQMIFLIRLMFAYLQ